MQTLILILFTDASQIDLRELIREHRIPVRPLSIGLPLTIVAGTVAAAVFLHELTFWEGAVLATILAPTDAALGQAVVSSPRVPDRLHPVRSRCLGGGGTDTRGGDFFRGYLYRVD